MIKIGKYKVGSNHAPFIIAEMSGNHNQSFERAIEIVEASAKSGAHALKLQTYTKDTMTIDHSKGEFIVDLDLWKGASLYDLYEKAYTPWEWHEEIFKYSRKLGMIPFSTPFDITAVEFLEKLNVDLYKIASFENTDIPLIQAVASTGKPMIISTGMMDLNEMDETVRAARSAGCKELILLKCTSAYPASPKNSNLLNIPHMKKMFNCEVGLSDHTLGIGSAVASVALGATVIEKHITLSREDGGVDSTFSMEPDDMKALVTESKRAWQSVGKVQYGPSDGDIDSRQYRRSLYIVKDMKKGETLTSKNLRAIRPGLGLPTKYLETLIGKKVNRSIKRGTALSWKLLG
ncbi:pseudaminic acid synthase [Gammaproteobacteria bacterium]|nr:pseudaminic acid synthase [Gammaproteobacteria bacterium]